ncbi:MAG: DNA adenine methylase [Candidatus Helarchaeota archaeon]|nr:DNA adenine methylase [Candidatus Helarchaeota archaeon]
MKELYEIRKLNSEKKGIVDIPHPFVKWAGGKRQLLNQIDLFLPKSFKTYIEPFVGGGALFFYILPKKAILIDNNPVLINAFNVVKNNVEELIQDLKKHKNNSKYFYQIRNKDRTDEFKEWSPIKKASRFIYLNKCCYNGLYRVNSKGYFNVPFGKYKNPKFCDERNLNAVHSALQNIEIIMGSFDLCLTYAKKDDFIYLDPPYYPVSKTSSFTSYTKENFNEEDQIYLKNVVDELNHRGCKILLSNSYCEFITDLYGDYKIEVVTAKRAINCNGAKRGDIKEVLVMNYEIEKDETLTLTTFIKNSN